MILEFDKQVTTDRVQYGYLSGVQVIQAALSLLAALQSAAIFLAFLDLSKAYDSIIKQLLLAKLRRLVEDNLGNQLLIFLVTVRSTITGDIAKTQLLMEKGLTQDGTLSPALFRMYINDLPEAVRAALR